MLLFKKTLTNHQIFHFLNKKVKKKIQEILPATEWIILESFIRQNRLIDITPEHDVHDVLTFL